MSTSTSTKRKGIFRTTLIIIPLKYSLQIIGPCPKRNAFLPITIITITITITTIIIPIINPKGSCQRIT